jgi:transposase InsO family protein
MAIIDCCTREIVAWSLELRCRGQEAIAVVERAAALHGIEPGELTLGTDNGPAFTARALTLRLAELGIKHRRGGYRDPESQAFIESWFGKLKEREVWLNEYETLDAASAATSTATTTARTAGSTTGRPSRCVRPGKIYKNSRPELSTPGGAGHADRAWSSASSSSRSRNFWIFVADIGQAVTKRTWRGTL